MNYIDLAILVGLLVFVAASARRGALALTADLIGVVISVLVALRGYSPVGLILSDHLGVPASYANAFSFLAIFLAAQVLLGVLAQRLLRLAPMHWHRAALDRVLGVVPAVAHGLILTGALLLLLVALPPTSTITPDIERSRIGGPVLERALVAERTFAGVFGDAIQDTLAFLTVPPTSGEQVTLPATPSELTIDPAAEAEMLALLNEERESAGLSPLTIDPTMVEVARTHSRDMWERRYFSHENPDGDSPFDRMADGGVAFLAAGENLALAPTTGIAHRGLMNSPGHRRNIMEPSFGRVGIGVIDGGPHGKMFTQVFAD